MSEKGQEIKKITLPEIYNKLMALEGTVNNMLNRLLMQQELLMHLKVLEAKTLLDTIQVPTAKENTLHNQLQQLRQQLQQLVEKDPDNPALQQVRDLLVTPSTTTTTVEEDTDDE